jgi:hypothetical protein
LNRNTPLKKSEEGENSEANGEGGGSLFDRSSLHFGDILRFKVGRVKQKYVNDFSAN